MRTNTFKMWTNTGGDEGHKRVDKLASSLLLALLNVLPPRTRHLAGEITNFKSELSDWWTFQVLYLRKFFKSKKLIE